VLIRVQNDCKSWDDAVAVKHLHTDECMKWNDRVAKSWKVWCFEILWDVNSRIVGKRRIG
jgi:hypothetical protein